MREHNGDCAKFWWRGLKGECGVLPQSGIFPLKTRLNRSERWLAKKSADFADLS
jgi:hypothetical protein